MKKKKIAYGPLSHDGLVITDAQKNIVRKRIASTNKSELLEWRKAIKKLKF